MNYLKKSVQKGIALFMVAVFCIIVLRNNAAAASKNFEFTYDKVTVTIDSVAADLIKAPGKANDYKRTKSCAYKGYDRTYVFDDFTLKTYSKSVKGKEYVSSILLTSGDVSTKEKIKVGSTKKEMIKAYGKGKGQFGVYTYTKGNTKLVIELDDSDKVLSIEYMAK